MCLLKLNSSWTWVEYVTIATRVSAGKMEKYSIKLNTNCFSKLKLLMPILPDLSITKTMSIFDEAIERKTIADYVVDIFALKTGLKIYHFMGYLKHKKLCFM